MEKQDVKKALEIVTGALEDAQATGPRHIVVLDRGFVFVGDLSYDKDDRGGMWALTNAKNVRKWERGGFGGLTKSAEGSGATLDPSQPINFRDGAMILCVPVGEDWDE